MKPIKEQILSTIDVDIWDKVSDQISSEVRAHVWHYVHNRTWGFVHNIVLNSTRSQVAKISGMISWIWPWTFGTPKKIWK